ncbi:MAG: glycosyltransferase family 2 protein, partial [Porticoccaceae bacterium]|nr:glycosyltransferase family 2 protein [Porticoccaceae bacterium]
MSDPDFKPCIIVPVYNHEQAITATMAHLLTAQLPIILVDDGSDPVCAKTLQKLASDNPSTEIIRLPTNRGKGGALKVGLKEAEIQGFSHALQIDADGQHATKDVPRFLAMGQNKPAALICGCPIYDISVPAHRYYARYLTHIWVWINSLSL